MHRALLLPEIVATILQTGKSYPGLLYNSLFVNRLFFGEASRILWYGCGSDWNSATTGHVTPDIRHLGQIVLQHVERAQFYANLIHVLSFRDEGEERDFADEALWHQHFLQLNFPKLKELDLFNSDNAAIMNTGPVVLHYAQSNLKHLRLHEASQISDSFLDTLSSRCSKLRWLTLNPGADSTITEDGLARFLEKTPFMEHIDLRDQIDQVWTQQAFDAIATYRNLELLQVPRIEEDWITAPSRLTVSTMLPKLRYLFTSIIDGGLENLHQFTPDLEVLSLRNEDRAPSHNILSTVSRFTKLTQLMVQLSVGSSISGEGLARLALNCPNLTRLCIADDHSSEHIPSASGITDELMDRVARSLPRLEELHLVFDDRTPESFTFQSLRSLGRRCLDLEQLTLTCNFDWDTILQTPDEVIFPKLWYWKLFNSVVFQEENKKVIKSIAKKIVALAPNIMDFSFGDPNEAEEALESVMTDICYGIDDSIDVETDESIE